MQPATFIDSLDYPTCRKGVRHGISRSFGLKITGNALDNLDSVSHYEDGSVVGHAWKRLCGGAYLVGPVDDSGMHAGKIRNCFGMEVLIENFPADDDGNIEIHGDECVYVFPDLLKAVAGTFRKGNLVGGFTYDVVDFVIPDVGLPFPVLSKKKQGSVIARSESTARDGPETPQQKFRSHDN